MIIEEIFKGGVTGSNFFSGDSDKLQAALVT